ncbi:hypothetical protein KEJ40_01395 [Candidatus Bathyarchaeota archaeon]|nr:hypothetical protein [Candidatus Bathyarchaeota archaeon]
MKPRSILKLLIAVLFIFISSWSAIKLYYITVNYGVEVKDIINIVFEIRKLNIEDEDTLEISVNIINTSDEYIHIMRLGVTLERYGVYLGGLYKEYELKQLTLSPNSNITEKFRIVSRGLSRYIALNEFTIYIHILASTRYVKNIPLTKEFKVKL